MADWTNDFVLLFLEYYKSERIIWDPMDSNHKDRKKINDAWVRLSEKLQRPIPHLKKKKESIMATFRGHLRKKKASIRSGACAQDIYKPIWFAFDFMENFLSPIYDCTTTINTEQTKNDAVTDQVNEEDGISTPTTALISATPTTSSQPTIRRRTNPPELQEAGFEMKEAFNLLNNAINSKRAIETEDEVDFFCKGLAKKLKKLPEIDRTLFMYEIDGMFIRRICSSNNSTTSSTSIKHPSPLDIPVVESFSRPLSTASNNSNESFSRPSTSTDVDAEPVHSIMALCKTEME